MATFFGALLGGKSSSSSSSSAVRTHPTRPTARPEYNYDLARQQIQSFLLDLRQHGRRYNFTNPQEVQRFTGDCLAYVQSMGGPGINEGHILEIIEVAPELANEPIIRDARAVLGHENANRPAKLPSSSPPPPPPQPDVASVAFDDTSRGTSEAGDHETINLAWQMANVELGERGSDSDNDDYDSIMKKMEMLEQQISAEEKRVMDGIDRHLQYEIETRTFLDHSSSSGDGPWYSTCEIIYWAEAHPRIRNAILSQFSAELCEEDATRPYCSDITIYMSEGAEYGAHVFFCFEQNPNPGVKESQSQSSSSASLLVPKAVIAPARPDASKMD